MAVESLFEVRHVVQKNSENGLCGYRLEYRSRTVNTGTIVGIAALLGVNAWSAWTPMETVTIEETVP